MARNDYSNFLKKDVFSDICIDCIIEKHHTGIIVLKVIRIIFLIAILLGVGMFAMSGDVPKTIWKKIIVLFFMLLPALTISLMCSDFLYKIFIKIVVKSIDSIKYYRIRRRKPKVLKKVLTFDVPIYSSSNENITKIEIGNTIVIVSHFRYTQNIGFGKHPKTITICQGDCYAVDIKNKSIPNGIWLIRDHKYIKIGQKYIKKGLYSYESKKSIIYADTAESFNNCIKNDIFAIGEKIYKAVNTSFILYFENNIMYYIELNNNDNEFEMEVFEFDIEKLLRRDLAILNNRVELAKILASV